MLSQIEQACKNNNHVSVMQCLNEIDSDNLKKNTFLKIIDYYENEEARFPVGYVILYIEWLLKKRDVDEAGGYIEKLNSMGIEKERIAELIYEYVIKPDEPEYEARFNSNLEMLTENRVLFSRHTFDFHDVKKRIANIRNVQAYPEKFRDALNEKKNSLLFVDPADMEMIKRALEGGNLVHVVYDDLEKFHHMLLFEDLSLIRKNIESTSADDAENIVFFAGRDMETIRRFFLENRLTVIPKYVIVMPGNREYHEMIEEIFNEREIRMVKSLEEIKSHYKNKDQKYYRELFLKDPKEVKVLLITSMQTTLNKHITRNWHDSFSSLGYTTELLIEAEPYERLQREHIAETVRMFKPDMVFYINHTINEFSMEKEIKNNLLWIMRYRDHNEINYGNYEYGNENMFVLPHWWEFSDILREKNIPDNRICYTVEGIDTGVFKKREKANEQYACDIVSVNNSVGNESFRLEFYLRNESNNVLKGVMRELYSYMEETALADNFVSEEEILKLLYAKCSREGYEIPEEGRQFWIWFYRTVMNCFYRRRVMDWIVDSNITKNIKVWGGGWSNVEKFRGYHMGIAGHGRQLSEIYQGSGISLSDNCDWNTHERNYEIMGSGGFPLIKHIEVEAGEKMDVITNYFKENEEVVLFHDREDLLTKIQYYLDNPLERERIAENGRRVVIEKFSNLAITEKTIDFIREFYLN